MVRVEVETQREKATLSTGLTTLW